MPSRLGCARSWFVRTAAISSLALAVVATMAVPAAAGGSWLRPVRDRYEQGEMVTLVGYVGPGGTLGSVEDGPFFAHLRRLDVPLTAPNELAIAPFTPQPSDLPLGELVVQNTGRPGYLAYRVSIQFRLPSDLRVGRYGVVYCNSTCTKGLSDLVGGVVFVGRDPDAPISRTWPPDEPERANLEGNASLAPELPATSIPVTTAPPTTAANAERTAHRASAPSSDGSGRWSWALPALLVTTVGGASGIALFTRARLRR
jgi:hypothetical protein